MEIIVQNYNGKLCLLVYHPAILPWQLAKIKELKKYILFQLIFILFSSNGNVFLYF